MKYLFFSDVHLGCPLFKVERQLINLLTTSTFDKVFIVGDLIDTWEMDLDDILKKYKKLITVLNIIDNLVIIHGNHDPDITTLSRIFPNATVVDFYEDDKFVIIHGDQYDDSYNRLYFLVKMMYPLVWVCERIGINTKSILKKIDKSNLYKVKNKKYKKIMTRIDEQIINSNIDKNKIMVAGHTHIQKKIEFDYTYINTGSLIENKSCFIYNDNKWIPIKLDEK